MGGVGGAGGAPVLAPGAAAGVAWACAALAASRAANRAVWRSSQASIMSWRRGRVSVIRARISASSTPRMVWVSSIVPTRNLKHVDVGASCTSHAADVRAALDGAGGAAADASGWLALGAAHSGAGALPWSSAVVRRWMSTASWCLQHPPRCFASAQLQLPFATV